jgi:DNA-binding transcriptional ArsR family regulator
VSACSAIEEVDSSLGRNQKFCYVSLDKAITVRLWFCQVKPANANHVFRALADPTRRAIFEELTRQGEQTVHALTRYAGVSQPAVSKHLTVLKRAKLVRHRREGRETHYRVQPDALAPMVDWLNLYGAFWRDRFDRLEALLERMEP